MNYIDGFVAAVPTANRDAYRKHAAAAAPVFKEHGALKVVECWGDDVPEGKVTSFPGRVPWIVWPSEVVPDGKGHGDRSPRCRRRHIYGTSRLAAHQRPSRALARAR